MRLFRFYLGEKILTSTNEEACDNYFKYHSFSANEIVRDLAGNILGLCTGFEMGYDEEGRANVEIVKICVDYERRGAVESMREGM